MFNSINIHLQMKLAVTLSLVLGMAIAFQPFISNDVCLSFSPSFIYGKVTDANTGLPIFNATLLMWDLNTLEKPRWGSGIHLTNERGEYNISGPYLKRGHTYLIYAYRGNFTAKTVDYVPAVRKLKFESSTEVSFSLVPGALIDLKGTPYIVQSSSPGGRIFIKVLCERAVNAPFVNEYGSSVDAWFLDLSTEIVIVPADKPVILEAQIWFFSREQRRISKEVFLLYNGSSPFLLPQGHTESAQIASYSLWRGLKFLESRFVDVSSQLDEAQSIGFVVFDERRSLTSAHQRIIDASATLTHAQDDDYLKIWVSLREVLGMIDSVSIKLQTMRLISKTGAVYLSAIMATFSIVLAFFFFEEKRKKMISSITIYIIFLISLYFSYPGAHIIIDENILLFSESAAISFLGVSALVFGLPRVWKERTIEGEVSWRSAISIIFSMGKRQIRLRKMRAFFTILSMIILILAFTSLTSFETVFDIVSERLNTTAPSDGVMLKRMLNKTSLLFSPLGSDDPVVLSRITKVNNVALRLENIPSSSPVARLVNSKAENSWLIYGILGITPLNESIYVNLDDIIEDGDYLSETRDDEILIGRSVASNLKTKVGENITLEVLVSEVSKSFIVKGIIDDEKYMSLVDMDGAPFGPSRILSDGSVRICNSTEVVIMSMKAAENLQEISNTRFPEGGPQIALLSEIVFQPKEGVSKDLINTLIFVFDYDVFVSSNKIVTYYHIGSYVTFKGVAELLIPLVMVGLNVSMVMVNSVYERRKEIRTLSMLGLNPTHIGLIFLAEAVILGMVGGSLGYLFGLGFYRIMVLFGQELMVREKLEWWWSAISFAIALTASVLSAIRPAALAVSTYTPSKIKRIKISEEEMKIRKEEVSKIYQARELSMPVKVGLSEKEFFIGLFLDRLDELSRGYVERVENLEEVPEIENVKGELVKTIRFDYCFVIPGREMRTINSLILTKSPKEDYYRVRLVSEPFVPGMPENTIERTIDFVYSIILYWAKNKKRIMGA